MRQVVNGAKGGPLLGQSSCIIRPMDQCDGNFIQDEEMMEPDSLTCQEQHQLLELDQLQQRRKSSHTSPKTKGPRHQIERERRLRREIANSNERRRMQSINQGYMSLKSMLPAGDSIEKLSKAAVLQNAADYMVQLLEERKQLLMRNAELTQAIGAQRQTEEAAPARRKRDMTESSDEGISMSYQPNHESEVVEELRRTVTELRVQLERESQRRALLEQSYTYSLMAAQAASQPNVSSEHIPTTVITAPISPPQSWHDSVEEKSAERLTYHSPERDTVNSPMDQQEAGLSYGKASSVASQNLSIIVEAINHLEGDTRPASAAVDKETDSGISHGESSDDAKSERSVAGTPQPPPAHQSSLSALSANQRPAPYIASPLGEQPYCLPALSIASSTPASVPLLYRPTFLSNYISSQPGGYTGPSK